MRVINGNSARVLTIECGSLATKATQHGLAKTGAGGSRHSTSGI